MAYVDIDFVKVVGSMPPEDVDAVVGLYPDLFDALAKSVSAIFDARLAKRYAAPFQTPYPEALRWHVAQVVVAALWQKRGYNPGSAQDQIIQQNKAEALEWLKEAADGKDGLIDLPLRSNTDASGISRGGPRAYHEQSPYTWTDLQRADGRREDKS
jgi:phage gp36-like protein